MRNGGAGTISATANVNPAAIYELYQKCSASTTELDALQARLNIVRAVFSSRNFPSMIAAVKQAIAIYANDSEWARVRPPLIELTTEQAELLGLDLKAIGFAMKDQERVMGNAGIETRRAMADNWRASSEYAELPKN